MSSAYVIANPRSGKGTVGEAWERMLRLLHRAGLDPLGDLTQEPGHAIELAARARRAGAELVVAAGGDGTVHEVVNGLLSDGPGADVPMLGLIPTGSGCDFAKTFDIPANVEAAVARLAKITEPATIDVGRVTYASDDGEQTRLFANIAEVGLGPAVVDRAVRMPRWLGGAVYLAAFWAVLPGFARPSGEVVMDGHTYEGPVTNLVVANGRVFGGGMRVAPSADPGDGRFDVQVHFGSKIDYVLGVPKVYRGTHLPHPRIAEHRASTVTVTCAPDVLVEADGEVLGRTPARFAVLPGALRLKV